MKRAIIFLLTSAVLTACVGNASLWGQYQTPTPVGGVAIVASPSPRPLPPPACSQPRVCVGTMTLINRSFLASRAGSVPDRRGRRAASASGPSSEPASQIAIAPRVAGLLEPTRAGSSPCRNPGLLDACGDLPHFGRVRNTSTVARPQRAACHRCWLRHDARHPTEVSANAGYRTKSQYSVAKAALLHCAPTANPFHRCANITAICTKTR